MADPNPQTKPHFPISKLNSRIQQKPIKQGKSCSDFLIKSLFLALFIVVIPLFPSQAPDFLNQPILTKLWELLHLLFIGIAVAYGLFSRRNVELETHVETQSSDDNNTPSYVSKMFPASNIFGDVSENQNLYGFDEKKLMHYWNPERETSVDCSNRGTDTVGVFNEQCNTQFPVYDDSFDYSVRFDGNGTNNGTNVVQSWNSEYYHSEPVVVAQPYYGSGECGEVVGHKPLGLPVRSLKLVARDVDGDGPKFANEIESDSSSGSRGLDKSEDREFGDVEPSNLEKLFNDADAGGGSASPIPWNSRGRRMEREKRYGNVTGPSHFSPHSVDETKFEAIGSRSLQSTTSYSSHPSMYSSFDSISSDNMEFQAEEMRQNEASYVPASENTNFQEKDMGLRKTSYVPAPENMFFEEEDMEQRKTAYVSASENKNFQEKGIRQRKTSYVSAPENMIFQEEDIEQRQTTAYVPASESTNFQKRELGKKISKGVSSRIRRMKMKGKYAGVSYPSHLRPTSVDETQTESLSSESFQSAGKFSSHKRMYSSLDSTSSDNTDFQEEDMGQEKTSENMSFQEEEDMEHKETSYVHASENVNFQEEELRQEKTSYVPASENMNFQEVDLSQKISQVSSRNGMLENRGNYAAESPSSNFRKIFVDETQHESLSSRSFQSMGSFSSQTSLRSRSSVDSVSSENTNSLQEGLGEKKSLHGSSSSSSSSSPSASTRRNSETSLQRFQDDLKNDLNDDWRGINGIGSGDSHGSVNKDSGMHALQSSDSDKPASLSKTPPRGKSVRTRRGNGLNSGTMKIGETSSREAEEKVAKKPNNVDKMKSGEPDLLIKGIGKKSLDSYCPKPEVSFFNRRMRDKLEPSNSVSKESSDEDVVSEHVNDSGLDSEVDKKASEFIAKFKAQIRLQKMDSFDRSKGQKIFGNIIR